MKRRVALIGMAVAVFWSAAAVAGVSLWRSDGADGYRGSRVPAGITLEPFALESYRGERVTSESLRGTVVALTFLESQCKEACPVIAFDVARGVERLSSKERKQAKAIAISVHPEDDTAASVREFLRKRRALGKLDYLIGSEAELRPVWRRYYILSALDSGDADTHSASVHIYDRKGFWVSSLHPGIDLTPENLAHDIRRALQERT
jgi:protein SCO1/2